MIEEFRFGRIVLEFMFIEGSPIKELPMNEDY
jgi:hypothetical protein